MARNDRLSAAMRDAGISTTRLAAEVGVDPKTAERWVTQGRTPHPQYRTKVAKVLDCDPAMIWSTERPNMGQSEVVHVYNTRREIPYATWRGLMAGVQERFELWAFAATFLSDQTMNLGDELVGLVERGVRVRLLLGDPAGAAVQKRAEEENSVGLAGRVDLVLGYMTSAIRHPDIEVRLHDETLYNSHFRFDDDLLVNTHIWGGLAGNNPVLHLRKQGTGQSLVDGYQEGFERVWEISSPLTTWPRPRASVNMG